MVKRGTQRQLTDRAGYGQPSSGPPNIYWRGDSPIFERSISPNSVKLHNEKSYMSPTSS